MSNNHVGRLWLLTPWLILLMGAPLLVYWLVEPVPVRVQYVAPAFLTAPAANREEAAQLYTYETRAPVLWRYIEYCVDERFSDATMHRSWVGRAIVWHAPNLPTYLSRAEGCRSASVAVDIPESSPAREFKFVSWLEIRQNPLKTSIVSFEPLPLRILDHKQ